MHSGKNINNVIYNEQSRDILYFRTDAADEKRATMETKKTRSADLEHLRAVWLVLGLVFALVAGFVALEYTTTDGDDNVADSDFIDAPDNDVELLHIKSQQSDMVALVPGKPKREASPTKIKVVDNTVATQKAVQLPGGTKEQVGEGEAATTADGKGNSDQTQALQPVGSDMNDNPLNLRVVEDLPQFPGGAVELMKWLTKNLHYPPAAQRARAQGKVVVQFVINKEGAMTDLKIVKSLRPDCDREALRVMHLMPRWKPGVHNDKPCRTMVRIPIVFKL